jgi:hypothetical protein
MFGVEANRNESGRLDQRRGAARRSRMMRRSRGGTCRGLGQPGRLGRFVHYDRYGEVGGAKLQGVTDLARRGPGVLMDQPDPDPDPDEEEG